MIRLVMIAVALLGSSVTTPSPADEAKREWTFIYVMSYDNNLEGCADIINRGLQRGVINDRVAVSVLEDRTDSKGLKRIVTDGKKTSTTPVPTEDITSMKVLREHLDHATETLPAKRYALIFLNHGGKLDSMCADEHVEIDGPRVNGWMSAKACGKTVRDWSKSLEKDQLKMVFLQQCGRGSVENLYNFRDTAEVVLSSQLVVGAPNTYYTAVMKKVCTSPRMTGEKLAKLIMTEDQHYTNYVLVDGDAISDFPKKIDPLLKALLKKTDSFSLSGKSRPCFDAGAERNYDLLNTLEELSVKHLGKRSSYFPRFKSWVTRTLIPEFSKRRKGLPWTGLSTFIPRNPRQYEEYAGLPIYQETNWSRWAEAWLGAQTETSPGKRR